MTELEQAFSRLMRTIYDRAKAEAAYNATQFLRMLGEKGGVETARYMLREPKVSSGFVELHLRGRLDLTVEAQVLSHPEYWDLFDPRDLDTARRWLKVDGYEVP